MVGTPLGVVLGILFYPIFRLKKFGGEEVYPNDIIARQRGFKWKTGIYSNLWSALGSNERNDQRYYKAG